MYTQVYAYIRIHTFLCTTSAAAATPIWVYGVLGLVAACEILERVELYDCCQSSQAVMNSAGGRQGQNRRGATVRKNRWQRERHFGDGKPTLLYFRWHAFFTFSSEQAS